MAAGKDIADVLPNDLDYSSVADVRCSSLLRYIFTRKDHSKSFKHSIQDVSLSQIKRLRDKHLRDQASKSYNYCGDTSCGQF